MKNGTGYTVYSIDYDKKTISIDLSGNNEGVCYRNDPSIFFFVANSYKRSFYTISKCMNEHFESKANSKDIGHLILPYVFSFRHYLELELKAILSSVTGSVTQDTHSLKELMKSLKEALKAISENENEPKIFRVGFQENKIEMLNTFNNLCGMINQFLEIEPSVEYYRYIFKKGMTLENPVLTLDFGNTDILFKRIDKEIIKLDDLLRKLNIYVYFTL